MRTPCQYCGSNYCVCPAGTAALHARIAQLEADLRGVNATRIRELIAVLAQSEARLSELSAQKPATMRQALELIAAAKDVRGCDEIARQALGLTAETTVKHNCMACEDSGWLWDFNRKVPCDVCEAGPAWLHAQVTAPKTKGEQG